MRPRRRSRTASRTSKGCKVALTAALLAAPQGQTVPKQEATGGHSAAHSNGGAAHSNSNTSKTGKRGPRARSP